MSHCVYCGAYTALYVNGVPVCLGCVDEIEAGRRPVVRPTEERTLPRTSPAMSLTPVDGVGTVHLPIVSIIGVVGVWLWRTVRPMVGWMRLRRVIGRGR